MRKQHTKRDFSRINTTHMNTLQKYRFIFYSHKQTKNVFYEHLCDDDDDEEEHICLLLVQNCLNKWFCFCHDMSSALMSLRYNRIRWDTPIHVKCTIKQKDTKIILSANASFVCCCCYVDVLIVTRCTQTTPP